MKSAPSGKTGLCRWGTIACMKLWHLPLLLPVAAGLSAQTPSGLIITTIDKDAIDTTCKACDDFYQYAIGGWHARNPIPASKERWGKRWAAADGNKEVLQSIRNGLSARRDLRAGSEERKVADFYAACMDQATIEKAGVGPVRPLLERIAKAGAKDEFLSLMRGFLSEAETTVLLGITPRPDSENPRQTVAGSGPIPIW